MKKLLIAMTAVAVGTCAWATEGAGGEGTEPTTPTTTTYFTETFADWSNDAEAGYVTSVAAPWSYGTVTVDGEGNPTLNTADPQADELKVVNGALSLNTGSKVLRGAFGESTVAIPTDGLYFNATIAFKDPSDTLPTLMSSDKFAIVALDNVESLEAGLTNVNTKAATNLWVIAHHETDGKRAYRLTGNLESSWFKNEDGTDATHTIVVKAYNNVVGTRAGFLVMLDGAICTVKESYAISTGNVIDFTTAVDGINNYLGYENSEVSLGERYQNGQLLLSMVSNSSLASVDFQGQGVIDELSLADAGADFGPDVTAKTVTFTGFNSTGIASISPSLNNGVYTIPSGTANGDIKFTVSLNTGYELNVTAGDKVTVSGSAPTYTVTYDYDGGESYSIALDVFEPAAYVGGTAYKTFSLALAAALSAGGEIKLMNDVSASLFETGVLTIDQGTTVEIDLNGFDIAAIYNNGTLKIKDKVGTGTVAKNDTLNASVYNEGTVTIEGGCFEAAITGGKITVSGGKFKVKPADSVLAGGLAFSNEADDDGYYSVVTATVTPLPEITIPDNATAEVEKAAVEAALGDQADEAVKANITNKTEYAEFKTWAGTVTGGAAAVVASQNAWVAFALDNAGLLDDAKVTLTDNDIKVESFGQDTAEGAAAGQFTLEISLKDVTIGAATKANLLKIFEAVGTTDLKADFTAGAVTTDVEAANGKAKFKVAPSAATKPNAFFFKAQIKK